MRDSGTVLAVGVLIGTLGLPGWVPAQERLDSSRSIPADCDIQIGAPFDVPTDVPVEVRDVQITPFGVVARVVNVAPQSVVAYQARLSTSCGDPGGRRHFLAVTSSTGIDWRPGAEITVKLPFGANSPDATVHITAVVLADGTGHGDMTVVTRFQREARAHVDGRQGVLALLQDASVPASDEDLQALIDRIALAMARVPVTGASTTMLTPYVESVAALRRLVGREIAGTERMAHELATLRTRLDKELQQMATR